MEQINESQPIIETETNDEKEMLDVSDEYLNKKKRNRRIVYSIISFLVLAIAIVIITLGSIRIDLKPKFLNNDSIVYTVSIKGSEKMSVTKGDNDYNEFMEKYNQAFRSTYLTALFTGKLGGYRIEETSDNFYSNQDSRQGKSSKLSSLLGNDFVYIHYLTPQTLTKSNGDIYYSTSNTNSYSFQFEDVYFDISQNNNEDDLTFYIGGYGDWTKGRIIKISIRANTSEIYNFADGK